MTDFPFDNQLKAVGMINGAVSRLYGDYTPPGKCRLSLRSADDRAPLVVAEQGRRSLAGKTAIYPQRHRSSKSGEGVGVMGTFLCHDRVYARNDSLQREYHGLSLNSYEPPAALGAGEDGNSHRWGLIEH